MVGGAQGLDVRTTALALFRVTPAQGQPTTAISPETTAHAEARNRKEGNSPLFFVSLSQAQGCRAFCPLETLEYKLLIYGSLERESDLPQVAQQRSRHLAGPALQSIK